MQETAQNQIKILPCELRKEKATDLLESGKAEEQAIGTIAGDQATSRENAETNGKGKPAQARAKASTEKAPIQYSIKMSGTARTVFHSTSW